MDIFGRLDSRVLQHLSFGRRMQKVRIDRKGRVATLVLGDGDLVRLGEGQELLAAGEIPFAPRGDDADIGLQRIIAELEADLVVALARSEEHTSELQSLMRISYAVFCLKKKKKVTAHEEQVLNTT